MRNARKLAIPVLAAFVCCLVSGRAAAGLGTPEVVIEAEELRAHLNWPRGLLDAAALHAGIVPLSTGDVGVPDFVSIRGMARPGSRHVHVLVNGVSAAGAFDGSIDLSHVPAGLAERVEVYKAPLPPRFGSALAVINVVLAEPKHAHSARVLGATGGLGTQQAEVRGTTGAGPVWAAASFGAVTSENPAGPWVGNPLNRDVYAHRPGWAMAPALHLVYRPGARTRISLTSLQSSSRLSLASPERVTGWGWQNGLALSHRLSDAVSLSAELHGGMGEDRLLQSLLGDHQTEWSSAGGRVGTTVALPGPQALSAGAELRRDGGTDGFLDRAFSRRAVFLAYWADPLPWLWVMGGVRYDGASSGAFLNPSLDLRLQPWNGGQAALKVARSTRWPTLDELSHDQPISGERLYGASLELEHAFDRAGLTLTATGFLLRLHDEIEGTPIPAPLSSPSAVFTHAEDTLASDGAELSAQLRAAPGLVVFGNYTFNAVVRSDPDRALAYPPPPHVFVVGSFFSKEPYLARVSGRYLGVRTGVFDGSGQVDRLADAFVVDAYASREVADAVRVFVSGSNLLNIRYRTVSNAFMPGFTLAMGAEMSVP